LVKGEGFKADRICGNALQAARVHAMRYVDELVIFDLTSIEPDYDMVRKLTDRCFTPVTVGGGIKTVDHVKRLLRVGADKVCVADLLPIEDISKKFGKQCISVTVDVHESEKDNVIPYCKMVEKLGAGEIIVQSVPRDGTMQGYDLGLIKVVSESVGIPVVASGGCSGYQDMCNAIRAGASAVAVGALFLFTEATPARAAEYMHENGIEVRL